jgi:hypothetical protein
MESYEDILGNITEFSIGLAGFSAIATAFLHRSRDLSPVDRYRVVNLLLLSLTPAFVAFLCIGLASLLGNIEIAARASSAAFAIWLVFVLAHIYRMKRRLPPDHANSLNNTIFLYMYLAAAINIVAQIVSAFSSSGYYWSVFYFGLIVVLLQAVVQFVRILIGQRVHDDA